MIDYHNDLSKRENLIHFIKVTQKLIEEEGLQSVSIRRIGTLSGFHSSTIYLYFKDLNELIMLASIKSFQKYSAELEKASNSTDPYENFYAVWECFTESALQYSCVFHNFFFGKYGNDLLTYLNTYYDLFPEEVNKYNMNIESMYFGNNYAERCRTILLPLINDARTRVTESNIEIVNDITVSLTKVMLEKKCHFPELDSQELYQKIFDMLHFIIDRG